MKLYTKIRELFIGEQYRFAIKHANELRNISDKTINDLKNNLNLENCKLFFILKTHINNCAELKKRF